MSALARAWLELLGLAAVQGALLAVVAFAIGRVVARPAWRAALWLVVVAKLALPWGPAMPWSLSDLLASWRGHDEAAPVASVAAGESAAAAPSVWSGWLVLLAIWLLGAAWSLARAVRAQRAAHIAARRASDADAPSQELLRTLAARMRVRAPRLVIGDAATGPHVVGFFRTTIVVPPGLDGSLLRAALLHELAHIRRRDVVGRAIQIAATSIMWWFPVARFAARRLDAAREAACDAWALEAGDLPRTAYARLLVQMAALRAPAAAALAVPHALDARVAAVLGPPARARLGLAHRLALVAWIALALGGARRAEAHEPTCKYSPELAEALIAVHPEADLDGDGVLSRDEACELQAELRAHPPEGPVSTMDETLLSEPLCCNCDQGGAYCSPVEGALR